MDINLVRTSWRVIKYIPAEDFYFWKSMYFIKSLYMNSVVTHDYVKFMSFLLQIHVKFYLGNKIMFHNCTSFAPVHVKAYKGIAGMIQLEEGILWYLSLHNLFLLNKACLNSIKVWHPNCLYSGSTNMMGVETAQKT